MPYSFDLLTTVTTRMGSSILQTDGSWVISYDLVDANDDSRVIESHNVILNPEDVPSDLTDPIGKFLTWVDEKIIASAAEVQAKRASAIAVRTK